MANAIHRRDFLKTASLTAASFSLGAATLRGQPPELIKNSPGHPRLLSGCCAYSYRKYLQNGPMTMEDFILEAVELEIDGVDVTTYYLKSTEPSYLLGLRRLAFRNGVPFSGAAISTDMCQPDPAKRAAEIEKIKKWLEVTELLDLERVWKLFAQGGYKGFTSAEYEGDEDPKTGAPKLLARIKTLNKKYSTV
jgi:hypothetical protein